MGQDTTRLYRFFDEEGTLLYVGITRRIEARLGQHERTKPWWDDVAHVSLETFVSREAALLAEREAIVSESPKWNIQHAVSGAGSSGVIGWLCDGCDRPVADGDGYVHVDWMRAVEQEREPDPVDDGRLVVLGDWVDDRPAWRVHHVGCDPRPDGDEYWVSVAEVRSWPDWVRWCAHMSEKRWLAFTRWSEFLYRVSRF